MIVDSIGNPTLLETNAVAYLCSRKYPASIVLKSYDWAREMRDAHRTVIIGNHSQIERDVFHYLLAGKQPIIVALARGIPSRFEKHILDHIESGRLLIVSPFPSSVKRASQQTALKRNRIMAQLSSETLIAFADPNGSLFQLVVKLRKEKRNVSAFDVPENEHLFSIGVPPHTPSRSASFDNA